MTMMENLLTGVILLLTSTFTYADIDTCVQEVEDLHVNQSPKVLLIATEVLYKNYNETCEDLGLCEFEMSEETQDYLNSDSFGENPQPPTVPLEADITAEFVGFEQNAAWNAYLDSCTQAGGKTCRVNVDFDMKGEALDLIGINFEIDINHAPVCLTDACDGEDLEQALEAVVKQVILRSREFNKQELNLINRFTVKGICEFLGLTTCIFDVKDVDCSGDPIILSEKSADPSSASGKAMFGTTILAGLASSMVIAQSFWDHN